jgi:16S rRNA (cytidine1402-2'-O)-methyltransferase
MEHSNINKEKQGTLIMAGTHLGNISDIPTRALEVLKTADVVVFEEDKPARQVLKAAGVHRPWLRFSEQKEAVTIEDVRSALHSGKTVVYMSDQGMPGVADPGTLLVREAAAARAAVRVIPGPSSITAAIAACPFAIKRFYFAGLPPRDEIARQEFFVELFEQQTDPSIVIDTPYRLRALLESLNVVGFKKRCFIALDISGEQENYVTGLIPELLKKLDTFAGDKLNFVMIFEGNEDKKPGGGRPPQHGALRRRKSDGPR